MVLDELHLGVQVPPFPLELLEAALCPGPFPDNLTPYQKAQPPESTPAPPPQDPSAAAGGGGAASSGQSPAPAGPKQEPGTATPAASGNSGAGGGGASSAAAAGGAAAAGTSGKATRARAVIRIKKDPAKAAAAGAKRVRPDLSVVDPEGTAAGLLLRDVHLGLLRLIDGTGLKPGKRGPKQPAAAEMVLRDGPAKQASPLHWTQRVAHCLGRAGAAATGLPAQVRDTGAGVIASGWGDVMGILTLNGVVWVALMVLCLPSAS